MFRNKQGKFCIAGSKIVEVDKTTITPYHDNLVILGKHNLFYYFIHNGDEYIIDERGLNKIVNDSMLNVFYKENIKNVYQYGNHVYLGSESREKFFLLI
jgi:hypothetical protein